MRRANYDGGPISGPWFEPWLIQRLTRPVGAPEGHPLHGKDNPFAFGGGLKNGGLPKDAMDLLRPIFGFDYMGAAEFEFGAIPKALQSMVGSIKDLAGLSFDVDLGAVVMDSFDQRDFEKPEKGQTKKVYLIGKVDHLEPAQKYIRSMVGRKPAELKGRSHFKEAVLDLKDPAKDVWRQNTQGWWDLNNCLMFFTDLTMFEKVKGLFFEAPKVKA